MKPLHVSAEQFRRGLTDFLSRAGFGGEHIVVERHEAPLAVLIPYSLYTALAEGATVAPAQPAEAGEPSLRERQLAYQPTKSYEQFGLVGGDSSPINGGAGHGRITIEPDKRGGKPCIRGLRITVYDVLSYLAAGMTSDEILVDFPNLTREDIYACLDYAAEREKRVLVAVA